MMEYLSMFPTCETVLAMPDFAFVTPLVIIENKLLKMLETFKTNLD